MAKFVASNVQAQLDALRKLGDEAGEIAQAMVLAGAEEMKRAWQTAIVKHGLVDTGAMLESVGHGKPVINETAVSVEVYPMGSDARRVRNAEKAFVQHYGSSRVTATRFVDTAESMAEKPVSEAMDAALESLMKKAGI